MKLLLAVLMFAGLAQAQTRAFELGANFDPSATPKFKGAASYLETLDGGTTYSYTSLLVNKPDTTGTFTYSVLTGIMRKLKCLPWVCLYGDIQGGVAMSGSATSGAGTLNGEAVFPTNNPHISAYFRGGGETAPVSGGFNMKAQAGIRVTP